MHARSILAVVAIVGLLPTTARSFNLVDIGLFNGIGRRLQLLIDYSNGRRIDWAIAPDGSILMTRGFGEHITRVTVAATRPTYDVAALRQSSLGHRHDPWLYFSGGHIRPITGDEKRALEHATPKA